MKLRREEKLASITVCIPALPDIVRVKGPSGIKLPYTFAHYMVSAWFFLPPPLGASRPAGRSLLFRLPVRCRCYATFCPCVRSRNAKRSPFWDARNWIRHAHSFGGVFSDWNCFFGVCLRNSFEVKQTLINAFALCRYSPFFLLYHLCQRTRLETSLLFSVYAVETLE